MAKSNIKNRHLREKGRQYVFHRRWPKAVADTKPSKYNVVNLGTSDIIEARIMRDRLVAEMDYEAHKAEQMDVHRSAIYATATAEEREALEGIWSDELDAKRYKGITDEQFSRGEEAWTREEEAQALGDYRVWTGKSLGVLLNLERWIAETDVTAVTEDARRTSIKRFVRWSPVEDVREIDKRLAGKYVSYLVEQGYSNKTVNSHVSHLNVYWHWLLKRGIIDDPSPWARQQLKNKNVIERQAWTLDECRHIISKANRKLLLEMAWFGPLSGMRAGEICKLRVSDCLDGFMVVRAGKTSSARRRVPVHPQLEPIVQKRCNGKKPDDLLFPELLADGKNLTKRYGRFLDDIYPDRRVQRQASKTFHSYRHTFIDTLVKEGVAPHIVRQLVGHQAGKDMTLGVYYHGMTDEEALEAIQKIKL